MTLGHELGKNFSKFCIDFLHQLANFQFLFKCLEISLLELWCAQGDLNQKLDFVMQVLIKKKTKIEFAMN